MAEDRKSDQPIPGDEPQAGEGTFTGLIVPGRFQQGSNRKAIADAQKAEAEAKAALLELKTELMQSSHLLRNALVLLTVMVRRAGGDVSVNMLNEAEDIELTNLVKIAQYPERGEIRLIAQMPKADA